MNLAIQTRMTLQEYLTYEDGTDTYFELVDGVLVEMGAECTINTRIAGFLYSYFILLGLPCHLLGFKQKLEVKRTYASARDPDLIVHTEESSAAMDNLPEACLKLSHPNPVLVIEVVSPGGESSLNYKRDYEQKPLEYADRGISEMWIVDPVRSVVKVGRLINHDYEFTVFTEDDMICSPNFASLDLTASQILKAGRS